VFESTGLRPLPRVVAMAPIEVRMLDEYLAQLKREGAAARRREHGG
jgi:hypothetical protein